MDTPTNLTCGRWTRYGKDRLYVTAAEDKVGWCDLLTGEREVTAERADLVAPFHAAVDQWLSVHQPQPLVDPPAADVPPSIVTPAPQPAEVPEPCSVAEAVEATDPAVGPAWVDLAANVPGQAARAVAEAEWAALKDRSKLLAYGTRLFGVKTDERNWRVGADGEETVGARLEKLTDHGWHVLHAVPVGVRGSDIDHILIGPGGVYTLNTKNHPGGKVWVSSKTVMVNGQRTDYLRNSRHEATRAAKLLAAQLDWPVTVWPGLVLLTGTRIPDVTVKSRPEDVFIWDRIDIPRVFKKAPQRLTPEAVAEIYAAARRSTTWQPEPSA